MNTKPLIYGLEQGLMLDEIDLVVDFPANIAQQLIDDEIDLGLVPVAVIPRLKYHHIVGDYGISCDGPVASVCLFSEVPLAEITEVLLDYQSRTSVRLAKILLEKYWKKKVTLTDTRDDFRDRIKGTTAGVVIGDRALQQRQVSPYIYDLGEAWKDFTGLPFVFAAWVSNKPLEEDFEVHFNALNRYGLDRLESVVKTHPFTDFDLMEYYTRYIAYELTEERRKGLAKYLEYLKEMNL
ncbi:hypothetical protein FPE01S_02_08120 [Flavihumibacter petaseus NBRC 106054]|uniref:Chorismate dehydratase n=2 Tax=Flavihumibacter TaxID=1004301 RepID=A0A0E9N219_9BACT|nr:hypothetical protein FPE01S_02_08120 [Flavihumibacter petaseus NBRC 106054]